MAGGVAAAAIDAAALAERLAERPCRIALFDIREAGEAEQGHVPSATFLPRRLIELRIDELIPCVDTALVAYDDGGDDRRAALAAVTLATLGYRDIRVLSGGLAAWRQAGHPVATGVNVPSKRFGEEVLKHDGVASISPDDLARMREAGDDVEQWDVRTPAEFARATLPGSRSVPGVEIVARAAEAARLGRPVIVHCAGRTRSIIAARTLSLLGVERVVALENGTMGWRLSGRSLVPGEREGPSPARQGSAAADLAAGIGVGRLPPQEVASALRRRGSDPVIVVDVRGEAAHAAGRIRHSVSRPGGQLIQCTDEVLAVEATPVILVDDGDGRAAMAGYWLRRMGFPTVALLDGGIPAWTEAGLPLAHDPEPEPGWLAALRAEVPSIGAGDMRAGHIVLDVGTSRDFKAGHVPGAAWLPRGWLEARHGEIGTPEAEIVVTASDERQALLGAAALLRLGRKAAWLAGGNPGWAAAGGTLERAGRLPLDLPPDVVDPPYLKGEAGMRAYLDWEVALTAPGRGDLR